MFEFKDAKTLKMPKIETGYNYENPIVLTVQNIQNKLVEDRENKIMCVLEQEIGVKVDKDELIKALNYDREQYDKGFADGQKAARKTGEWETTDAYPHNVYCSVCHTKYAQTHWQVWEDKSLPRNFCPNCGADMRGEE